MKETLSISEFSALSIKIRSIQEKIINGLTDTLELYVPLQGTYTAVPNEESFDLQVEVKSFMVFVKEQSRDPKVLLLLGNTGSGKSVFSQNLHINLWKDYKPGQPIPLWIPLPECEKPFESAVEEVLSIHGFDEAQINELKSKEQFIFIVDGFDELHRFQNVYVSNGWSHWNAKMLITCRSQAIYYQKDYDKFFMPFQGEKRLPHLLKKMYVAPFSENQIEHYLKRYHEAKGGNLIAQSEFNKVPGLSTLVSTPFLLHMTVETLPAIFASNEKKENKDRAKITQAELYDVFINQWFMRQEKKLKATGHQSEEDLKPRFWVYCQSLAQEMHAKQVSHIAYRSNKPSGRLFGKAKKKDNLWERYFDGDSAIIRSACPLRRWGENRYGFIHTSLIEYFATRAMYEEELCDKPVIDLKDKEVDDDDENNNNNNNNNTHTEELTSPKGGIHRRLFSKDRQGIRFLADRIEQSEVFKNKMLSIIEESKHDERYAIGSANAISALVRGGVMFNGADLSESNLSGAVLSGGYFDRANFENADLTDVDLDHVWMRKANLKGSDLSGVRFGEYPYFKHENEVFSIVYRPDINLLVAGSGKEVMLWDLESGECLHVFKGHEERVTSVSMSDDGMRVASGSYDKTVRVWSVTTGKAIVLRGHLHEVTSVSMSDDGMRVASGSFDEMVRVWNVATGKAIVLRGHTSLVECVHMSGDGMYVASGSFDKTVRVWDIASGEARVLFGHDSTVYSVHLNVDGTLVASGGGEKNEDDFSLLGNSTVRVWNLISGEAKVFRGHKGDVRSVHLSDDGLCVVSGSEDCTVRVWDVNVGTGVALRGHKSSVLCVYLSDDGKQIASGSDDKTVRVWDVSIARSIRYSGYHIVTPVHLSANGACVAVGEGNMVRVWDVASGQSRLLSGHEGSVSGVCLSGDGSRVVSGSSDNTVRVWDVASGVGQVLFLDDEDENKFETQVQDGVLSVYLSEDGKRVVSGGTDDLVRVWNVSTGPGSALYAHRDFVTSVCLSADGARVASGAWGEDKSVCVWDVASGSVLMEFKHKDAVSSVHLNGDGTCVASGSWDKTVRVSDVSTGVNVVLCGHEREVTGVHLSADGTRVVSVSYDGTIRVWDVQAKKTIATIHPNLGVCSISLNGEMDLLAVGLMDGSVQLWDRLDESGQRWQFKWSATYPNSILTLRDSDATGAIGLSPNNQRLLQQHEAITDLSAEASEESSSEEEYFFVKRREVIPALSTVGRLTNSPIYSNKTSGKSIGLHENSNLDASPSPPLKNKKSDRLMSKITK